MGMLEALLRSQRNTVQTANPRDPVLAEWWGASAKSAAGVSVTPDAALRHSAVWAAVRILTESVAALPLHVYKRLPDGGKERDDAHPLAEVLHQRPNRWQTALEFREMLQGHLLLRGNAFAQIVPGRARAVAELVPLHPDRMRVAQNDDGSMVYEYTPVGRDRRVMLQGEVLHLRGLSSDGIVGMSVVEYAREAIGIGLAADEFGARFYGHGAQLSGVLAHPGKLGDQAHARLKTDFAARYQGSSNAWRVAVLEEGMTWQQIGLKPAEAQFLDTRKFQATEIARLFRVPPHMIGDLERATFSNIEHLGIEFVVHTLRPWLVRWEQAISRDLFTGNAQRTHFAEHVVEGLLRGDSETRSKFYFSMFQMGALSPNDIRRLENQNPIEDGDQYFRPLNLVPLDAPLELNPPNPPVAGRPPTAPGDELDDELEDAADERSQIKHGPMPAPALADVVWECCGEVVTQAADRVATAEARALARARAAAATQTTVRSDELEHDAPAAAVDLRQFEGDAALFFARHREFVARHVLPVAAAIVGMVRGVEHDATADGIGVVDEYVDAGIARVRAALLEGADELDRVLEQWHQHRRDSLRGTLAGLIC